MRIHRTGACRLASGIGTGIGRRLGTGVCLLATLVVASATPTAAQETVTYETDPATGVQYRVTRRVTQQLAPKTEMQSREQKVFTPRTTTQVQTYQQAYLSPVTEYRWVSRMRGRWNPFVQPYWAQRLEPFTRWESRQSTVQVPTTKTDWVEEKRVVQTPVTTYQTVQNETISRVAVNSLPGAGPATVPPATFAPVAPLQPVSTPQVASLPRTFSGGTIGGHSLQSDPPRAASGWRSIDSPVLRR